MGKIVDLASRIADHLGGIEGVTAVTLGGSWARQEADSGSDIDLGIYYYPAHPPSIDALRWLAAELDDRHSPAAVTGLGEWGPWINGGAWLVIEGRRLDWLYRDLERVEWTIVECRAGRPSCDYQPGHPHGFHNHMYLGEIHYGRPLFDPDGILAGLTRSVAAYPPALKRALIDRYLWEAGFALDTSRKSAARGETFHVAGSLFRSAACLVQTLFALNARYFVNEKGSIRAIDSFARRPSAFGETVSAVLARPGGSAEQLRVSIGRLEELVEAVRELCKDSFGDEHP